MIIPVLNKPNNRKMRISKAYLTSKKEDKKMMPWKWYTLFLSLKSKHSLNHKCRVQAHRWKPNPKYQTVLYQQILMI